MALKKLAVKRFACDPGARDAIGREYESKGLGLHYSNRLRLEGGGGVLMSMPQVKQASSAINHGLLACRTCRSATGRGPCRGYHVLGGAGSPAKDNEAAVELDAQEEL